MEEKEIDRNEQIINFLYHSIQDIQSTIRAIDRKIFGLIVILVLPFSIIDKLYRIFESLVNTCHSVGYFLAILFLLAWIASITFSIIAVYAVDNPNQHIKGKRKAQGYFYGSNLFNEEFFTFLKSRKSLFNKSFEDYSQQIKKEWDVINELAFEQMKLVYIRSRKIKSLNRAIIFFGISASIGLLNWLINKIMT